MRAKRVRELRRLSRLDKDSVFFKRKMREVKKAWNMIPRNLRGINSLIKDEEEK